jgi:hypothetical protein
MIMDDEKWLKKPFDIQSSYTEIQGLVNDYGPPLVTLNNLPIYNASFLVELVKLAIKKGSELFAA